MRGAITLKLSRQQLCLLARYLRAQGLPAEKEVQFTSAAQCTRLQRATSTLFRGQKMTPWRIVTQDLIWRKLERLEHRLQRRYGA